MIRIVPRDEEPGLRCRGLLCIRFPDRRTRHHPVPGGMNESRPSGTEPDPRGIRLPDQMIRNIMAVDDSIIRGSSSADSCRGGEKIHRCAYFTGYRTPGNRLRPFHDAGNPESSFTTAPFGSHQLTAARAEIISGTVIGCENHQSVIFKPQAFQFRRYHSSCCLLTSGVAGSCRRKYTVRKVEYTEETVS